MLRLKIFSILSIFFIFGEVQGAAGAMEEESPSKKRKLPGSFETLDPKPKRQKCVEVDSYNISLFKSFEENFDLYIREDKRAQIINLDEVGGEPEISQPSEENALPFAGGTESEDQTPQDGQPPLTRARATATVARVLPAYPIYKKVIGNIVRYIESKPRQASRWHSLFSEMGAPAIEGSEVVSGAIFTTIEIKNKGAIEKKVFVTHFGRGKDLVEKAALDSSFGLFTILNILNSQKISKIAKTILGSKPSFRTESFFKKITADEITQEGLLKQIAGKFKSTLKLGETSEFNVSVINGGASLVLARRWPGEDFQQECAELHSFYKALPPPEFEWVRNIFPITNPHDIRLLDGRIDAEIIGRIIQEEKYMLPVSDEDTEKYDKTKYYRVVRRARESEKDYTSLEGAFREVSEKVKKNNWSLENLRGLNLIGLDTNYTEMMRCKVADCLHEELEEPDGSLRVLSEGRWYHVPDSYSKKLNIEINDLWIEVPQLTKTEDSDYKKTEYIDKNGKPQSITKLESNYIKRIVSQNPDSLYEFDQKEITGLAKGKSEIEVCDIFSKKDVENKKDLHKFIHIKNWTESSAPFSHLCGQAKNAAEVMRSSKARKKAKKTFIRYEVRDRLLNETPKPFSKEQEKAIKGTMTHLGEEFKKTDENDKLIKYIRRYLEKNSLKISGSSEKMGEILNTLDVLIPTDKRTFEQEQYMVVLGLLHKKRDLAISSVLPFFSRLTLRDTARDIINLGYKVGFTFIEKTK